MNRKNFIADLIGLGFKGSGFMVQGGIGFIFGHLEPDSPVGCIPCTITKFVDGDWLALNQ